MYDLITDRCWAIRPESLAAIRAAITSNAALVAQPSGQPRPYRGGAVAIVPVIGPLTQRGSSALFSATRSTADIAAQVQAAASDGSVDAIVLEIATPGGEVFGVAEAFDAIRTAAKQKPIVAAVNSSAASAGYWLATAATRVMVTPSGEVGSIGVYAMAVDQRKALENEGISVRFASAGKYKLEGHPYVELTDEGAASMQADVNRFYAMFTADVAVGRGVPVSTVREGFGEGRMVGAREAVRQGMADAVGTLAEAIVYASALARGKRSAAAAARELSTL